MPVINRLRSTLRGLSLPVLLAAAAIWLLLFVLLFGLNMRRGLNHDEHQFVGSAVLMARYGLQPYADFAYFHVPGQTWLNAALFSASDSFLLTARLAAIVWSWLSLGMILLVGLATAPFARGWARLGFATAGVAVLVASPLFVHTSGRAWNHDLPMFLALAGLLTFLAATWQPDVPPYDVDAGRVSLASRLWMLGAGTLLGLAIATRLSYAFLTPAFALAISVQAGRPWRQKLWLTLWLTAGGILGMAPVWIALATAPEGFLFGNVTYNLQLNTQYYAAAGHERAMTLAGKLAYFGALLLAQPGNLVVPLLFVMALLSALPALRRPEAFPLLTVLLVLPFALLGALSATPSQIQYYYMLYPFFVLGFFLAVPLWPRRRGTALAAVTTGALLAIVSTAVNYGEGLAVVAQPDRWYPVKVHDRGARIADLMDGGRVLTLAPIHAMEGGVPTYPEFVTGPLAWRVAHLVSAEERARQQLVTEAELPALLAADPPRAVLAGFEGDDAELENVLLDYAQANGFVPVPLPDEGVLWLSPLADWEGAIRLGAVDLPAESVVPGATVPLTLYLGRGAPIDRNLNVLVRVTSTGGEEIARSEGWPYGSATSTWGASEMWPDGHQLAIDPAAAPGIYRIEVSFYDPATLATFGDIVTTGYLAVSGAETPADGTPLATFGDGVDLLAVTTGDSAWQPDQPATVTLTWRPAHALDAAYTVFVQLIGPDGQMAAQGDQPPLQGFYPSDRWLTDQPFVDRYTLTLPDALPPGDYRVVTGFYDPATGQRLPVVRSDGSTGDAYDAATVKLP